MSYFRRRNGIGRCFQEQKITLSIVHVAVTLPIHVPAFNTFYLLKRTNNILSLKTQCRFVNDVDPMALCDSPKRMRESNEHQPNLSYFEIVSIRWKGCTYQWIMLVWLMLLCSHPLYINKLPKLENHTHLPGHNTHDIYKNVNTTRTTPTKL